MKIFLCGNTGIINRGCEAIIRATVKVLKGKKSDIFLATFAINQDEPMTKELGIHCFSYENYPSPLHRYFFAGLRKVFKRSLIGLSYIERPLFKRLSKHDICLNIGGDTYCYKRPIISLALTKYTKKHGIKNILWCCSIEKENIKGEILDDLNRYDYIFAREQITVNNLLSAGIDENKIVKVCDPAFFLDQKETELPKGFVAKNTVGINVSEMVIDASHPIVYSSVIETIRYILDETDMSVCLIPHVYSIKNNSNDYPILQQIKKEINSSRVCCVEDELNCEQLKYVISQCRFFIGARTHSTIAAYSSEIPTLVLGYSVKSKGIATDLFGTYDGYVLPYHEITPKNEVLAYFKSIMANETAIKQRLHKFLPYYKELLLDAIEKYLYANEKDVSFEICAKELCTGCGACEQRCPKNAITMVPDSEGFLYPTINQQKCIQCEVCKNTCPSVNMFKDDGKQPLSYAAVCKEDAIRLASSSGGIFTLLAQHIITQNGIVFGAALDQNMQVVHKACKTIEDLSSLRGSKYVQSDLKNCYRETEYYLKQNVPVLFTGTPCQIDGLYAYLDRDYPSLYTQDIICHGVPSPEVWNEYVYLRQQQAKSTVNTVQFRDKCSGWKQSSMTMSFENNTSYRAVSSNDPFMRGFLGHLYLRSSCNICAHKQIHRKSDITLGDFWGIEKIFSEMCDNKGISLVLIHSEQGQHLFNSIKEHLQYKQVNFKTAITENPSYHRSSNASALKKYFYKDFRKMRFDKIISKYLSDNLVSKFRRIAIKVFSK